MERTEAGPTDLVGRTPEIEELDRFLGLIAATPAAPAGVVIEGPAGIGKSTLWNRVVTAARDRGFGVMTARPSEAEARFGFQAIADLLEPIAGANALPPPQRRNLDIALRRADPSAGERVDAQAVAIAVANLVRSAATRQPILLAIDDAPWLDRPSASVLAFVVRRLLDRRVGVLLSQRVETPTPAALDLERAIPTDRVWVGPLGRAELHVLLASRLGLVLPRPTLAHLHEQSQGNPFHAIEIARALQRLPALPRPGEPFPVPEAVKGLIAARLVHLSEAARQLLLLVALAAAPTLEAMAEAQSAARGEARGGRSRSGGPVGLTEAIDASLVTVDDGAIRFSHPLIASTVAEAAGDTARRAAHRALAEVVDGSEARARHLALASAMPEADVAAALEQAAVDAERRGATDAAVELLRLSIDATPGAEIDRRDERQVRLGIALLGVGDLPAARDVLDAVIARLPAGRLRAEALVARSTIGWYLERERSAVGYLERALEALGQPLQLDPRSAVAVPADGALAELLGRVHLRLGQFHEDVRIARGHRATAAALLERTGAQAALATALIRLFAADVALGRPPDPALLERGLALEDESGPDATTLPGQWWTAIDLPDLARERYLRMQAAGRRRGKWSGEADLLTQLAIAEVHADDWPRARELVDEALMVAAQEGQEDPIPARRVAALLDAHEGRLDAASADALAARAFDLGATMVGIGVLHAGALAALGRQDLARVEELTAASLAWCRSIGWVEPLRVDPVPDRIEALVTLGRADEAARLLTDLERRGTVVPRPWLDAAVARGRGLLALARGEAAAAIEATNAAMDERAAAWRPFDRARTQLVRGRILRQLRRPREAGLALDTALATFDRLGARAFADQARAELGRLGRRRLGREDLTPAEAQVARLAASGLRNHEVAARLGVSPKTVEAHLARIYAKLGIRSRAELGRAMADPGIVGPAIAELRATGAAARGSG